MLTRPVSGLWGGRRTGSFAGKTASGAGSHPVGILTRVVTGLYGGRRVGSFAGKTSGGGGSHPVGKITRVTSGLWGARRTGSFAGKAAIVTSQSGVSRLARSLPLTKPQRVRRVWHIDLPEKVKEAIEVTAEEIISSPAKFETKSDRVDLLEQELLAEGIEYQEKYIEYLQETIAIMRQQMLEYAMDVLTEQQRLRRRKAAILLLLS